MEIPPHLRPGCSLRQPRAGATAALLIAALLPGVVRAASVTLQPSKDNTIFGSGEANLSNGAGAFLFAGSSGEKRVLRSLLAFDFAGRIPAGATVTAVRLTLAVNTPIAANANTVQVHRLRADWGEGSSRGAKGEGGGAPASTGDATWNHRFFSGTAWTTPGGDFASAPSASQAVRGSSGTAAFSGAGLVADVQAWVNRPAENFGWILVAQDEGGPAVRFASRTGAPAPELIVDFTEAAGGGNSPPGFSTPPVSQTVAAGVTVSFSVVVSGSPAPALQWQKDGVVLAGATLATLALPAVSRGDAGNYAVMATNAAGTNTSAAATLVVNEPGSASASRLSNLSVRAALADGQTLIVGFSMSGGSRQVLLRGVGPTLASFGVENTMADPRLELFQGGALVAENDNWGDDPALRNAFGAVGAFALAAGGRDAALLQAVDGTRSVQVKGTGGGVILVELYDTGAGHSPRLVNVSTRNQVGTGDNILIVGFFVAGTGAKRVLIRAVGPRLADLGVGGVLADPKVDVFPSGAAAAVASNDNWTAELAATFAAVGAFSLNAGSRDAALVASLAPGAYTVQVAGVNGATGEALVEIYEVP